MSFIKLEKLRMHKKTPIIILWSQKCPLRISDNCDYRAFFFLYKRQQARGVAFIQIITNSANITLDRRVEMKPN